MEEIMNILFSSYCQNKTKNLPEQYNAIEYFQ